MSEFLVTVVDRTKARLLTVEEAKSLTQSSPNLIEGVMQAKLQRGAISEG